MKADSDLLDVSNHLLQFSLIFKITQTSDMKNIEH